MLRPHFRPVELSLLFLPSALAVAGFLQLVLKDGKVVSTGSLMPALIIIGLMVGAHLIFTFSGFTGDQFLIPMIGMLGSVGLVFVYRLAGIDIGIKQTIWVTMSFIALLATLLVLKNTVTLSRFKYTWAFLGLFLMAITMILGRSPGFGGPRLWLNFGLFHFQPSEIMKILLVVFFAAYLSDYREAIARGKYIWHGLSLPPLPYLLPLFIMWGIAMGLIVVQKDLGLAWLIFGVFLVMLYLASGRRIYVVSGTIALVLGAFVAYQFVDIVQQRLSIWLDPWSQATTLGYQPIQGFISFAAGGILGTGLSYGSPDYIPFVHTDFVFAAIGEEMGLVGAMGLLLLYLVLIYRGYRIALNAKKSFNQLLAAGLTSVLALQTLIILGGNLKLLPLTGVALPFVSYGGSSLLANLIIVGILLRISAVDGETRGG